MTPRHAERNLLYRLFRQDIGRKLTALIFALLLFRIIDGQVTRDDTVVVNISYVNEGEVDRNREMLEGWHLLIVEKPETTAKPLVVAREDRKPRCILKLEGRTTSVDLEKSDGRVLVYRSTKEGTVTIPISDVQDIDELKEALGPNSKVSFDLPLEIEFSVEDEINLVLDPQDVQTRGEPAPGLTFRATSNFVQFVPTRVTLRGPRQVLRNVELHSDPLFKEISISGEAGPISQGLELTPRLAMDLEIVGEQPTVTIRLDAKKVRLENGEFSKAVQPQWDFESLKSAADLWQHYQEDELVFEGADEDGLVFKKLWLTGPERASDDQLYVELKDATDEVYLVVYGHKLRTDQGELKVYIHKTEDFPADLDVEFANLSEGSRVLVNARWESPRAVTDPSGNGQGE